MNIHKVISRPLVTEKSTEQAKNKVYLFEVHTEANKNQIKSVIEQLFKVTVSSVRVSTRKGKEKRVGRKMISKQLPDTKIAYITLKDGSIDLFPQA